MDRPKIPDTDASRRLRLKTTIFLIVVVTTGPLGAVFLRQGMRHAHLTAHWWDPVILVQISHRILSNGDVWLGIGSRIISGLAFMFMLSWADYSYVNPASSVNYVIAVFMGWAILGEVVPFWRWVGAILICLGVLFIGKTPARTTSEEAEEAPVRELLNAPAEPQSRSS